MSDYDFKTLNDKEFEILCADLLSQAFGHRFERFKAGRDLGVDGRFFTHEGGEVVLQCKHWSRTPISALLRTLATVEKAKIDKLKPAKYVLAISNSLSRADKQKIAAALSPHIKSEDDIFGCEDLNQLLSANTLVEERHYKLWLQSSSVLQNIINRAILGRSRDALLEIQEKSARYVITSNHDKALAHLEATGVVIITGEPGIGKTTLADHLCLHYAAKGFTFLKIEDDTIEAEALFDAESEQIFYFDDFLGRNYLEALSGHEGNKITSFIKRIVRNKNKRFILTSRSTILNQGKLLIDTFQHEKLDKKEYELKITSLSELDKAKILYNHIWHSDLKSEYIEEIYREKRYHLIISHFNYNPRLISYITDGLRLEQIEVGEYWNYIEKSLNNPAHIWEHPFAAQQDDFSRALIILLVLNSQRISEVDLSLAYHRFIAMPENQSLKGRQDFQSSLKTLTGSFFNRYIYSGNKIEFDLFNPSIGDFVLSRYADNILVLQRCLVCLQTLGAVRTLISLHENSSIHESSTLVITSAMINNMIGKRFQGYSFEYISDLVFFIIKKLPIGTSLASNLSAVCEYILECESKTRMVGNLFVIVKWGLVRGGQSADDVLKFLDDRINKIENDHEISSSWDLLNSVPQSTPGYSNVRTKIEEHLHEMLSDNVAEFIETSDAYGDFQYGEYEEARERLAEMVDEKLKKLGITTSGLTGEDIVESYDVHQDMDSFFQNSHDGESYRSGNDRSRDYGGEIDDLFDRG